MPKQPIERALLIVNPKARQCAEAELDAGIARLEQAGIKIEQYQSAGPEESRQAVLERKAALDLVIVGGGDGTISSMAGVLSECQLPLAVLPLGTANDLARSLGLTGELDNAFAAIEAGHRQFIDLGVVNGHYYFNVAHLGLGVKVTEELTDEVKKHWGVFSYLKALFAALARVKQFKVELKADGQWMKLRSIQLAVGNGRYYGGGNVVDEQCRINDGQLSLYSIRPQSLWELLALAPLLRDGKQRQADRVTLLRAKTIELITRPKEMEIHADGECVAKTPADFTLQRNALDVVIDADNWIGETNDTVEK
ncbi:lipid kinase [Gilvimarinus agarilyticus]|uniref:lipid kinase n=1 Tax=Gilvimarinus sp. 2_MG-2023 TaxID=3062666 RepID=UPI001C0864AB|nr:lipid kinase [Gilvimarinus sp. 2_MG-2023]MBU2885524.1 lipid kinase [Gilvimarinus agarilyticus]MDO6570423.1 lipid kinase [Gilvimarinus sp. 2_MG-2023]